MLPDNFDFALLPSGSSSFALSEIGMLASTLEDIDTAMVNWLKNEIGGVLVHLRQYSEFKNLETGKTQKDFLHPANIYEEINDPQIRENADYKLDWKKVSDTVALTPHIRKFVKWMENKD